MQVCLNGCTNSPGKISSWHGQLSGKKWREYLLSMRRVGRHEEEGGLWWGNLSDRRLVPVQCHLPLSVCHPRLTSTVQGTRVCCRKQHFREIEANMFNPLPIISMECVSQFNIVKWSAWRFSTSQWLTYHYSALQWFTYHYSALQCRVRARGWTWASVTATVTSPH